MYLQFLSFFHIDMTPGVDFIPHDKDLPSLQSEYHGCWWPGDARSQDISIHDVGLVKPG